MLSIFGLSSDKGLGNSHNLAKSAFAEAARHMSEARDDLSVAKAEQGVMFGSLAILLKKRADGLKLSEGDRQVLRDCLKAVRGQRKQQ